MKVIVRVWRKEPKTAILIFPEWPDRENEVMMFEWIGQHGSGDPTAVIQQTRPATDDEAEFEIKRYEKYYIDGLPLTSIQKMPRRNYHASLV
jgi:hypothetical protein